MDQTLLTSSDFDYDPELFPNLRAYQKFLKKKVKKTKHLTEKLSTEIENVIHQIEKVLDLEQTHALAYSEESSHK